MIQESSTYLWQDNVKGVTRESRSERREVQEAARQSDQRPGDSQTSAAAECVQQVLFHLRPRPFGCTLLRMQQGLSCHLLHAKRHLETADC